MFLGSSLLLSAVGLFALLPPKSYCWKDLFPGRDFITNRSFKPNPENFLVTDFTTNDKTVSYSGYLNVSQGMIHFWFFEAKNNNKYAQTVLWIGGNPASSALVGLFEETGPYMIKDNIVKTRDQFQWNEERNVLYMDPVGVGFSYATNYTDMSSEEGQGAQLYEALNNFYRIFPQYKTNDLYIWGSNTGAKLALATARKINMEELSNFRGVALGNAFLDPINMLNYSEILYSRGFLGTKDKEIYQGIDARIHDMIKKGEYENAYEILSKVYMLPDSIISQKSGIDDFENFGALPRTPSGQISNILLGKSNVLHVETNFNHKEDFFNSSQYLISVKNSLESLLSPSTAAENSLQVLLFSGNLNILAGQNSNSILPNSLKWSCSTIFFNSARQSVEIKNILKGFVQTGGGLSTALALKGGVSPAKDEPEFMYHMMTLFTSGVL